MSMVKTFMAKRCEHCPLCRHARKNPTSTFGRLMAWHGTWCPFWKAWQERYGEPTATDQPPKDTAS